MFDLIVTSGQRRPFHDRTLVPTLVSVAGHMVLFGVFVVLPLLIAADRLPAVPAMMAFVAAAPAPPPPPPPPPAAKPEAAKPTPEKPKLPPTVGEFTFPIEAPAEVRAEVPGEGSEGTVGGVEGGVVGGTVGGIVGGLTDAPPPPPPPPPPPAPSGPVRVGGQIQAPALIHRVEPVYPQVATLAQVSGLVTLEAVVDTRGQVESVKVLRSVKFLDTAAITAVKQWRYSPLVLNGIPTPFVISVTVSFAFQPSQ